MEDKHTKNWNLGELRGGYRYISGDGWGDFAMVVTKLDDDESEHPEGLANAELIAQAPTLLEQNRELKEALKTEISKSINPLDQGRISEEELTQDANEIRVKYTNAMLQSVYRDALTDVIRLPFIQQKLTIDERLEILNLYKK